MMAIVRSRTVERQGAFALRHLRPGLDVLDLGCGPGSITVGLARRVAPGRVTGLDVEPTQVEAARATVLHALPGAAVEVVTGSAEALPFADGSFDVVFTHALLEHLCRPSDALVEARRVLRPGGIVAVRCSDWSGARVEPSDPGALVAVAAHVAARRATGADPDLGARLAERVRAAGFGVVAATARHDEEASAAAMAAYLGERLDAAADGPAEAARARVHAEALEAWAARPGARLPMRWAEVVGASTT